MTVLTAFDFNGDDVRTVMIDGEPWFVLADLARVLGITRRPSAIVERLDDDVRQTYPIADSLGRTQNTIIVSEAGMYDVIVRSDSPIAKPFRRWVTSEVLPSIRKTGGYGQAPALSEAEIVQRALQITYRQVQELEAKVMEDAPKVGYVDTFVADADLLTLRTVAASLDVKETALRALLLESKWIYFDSMTRWSERKQEKETVRRYSAYAEKKPYFTPIPVHEAPRFKGEVMHTLKVTPAGAEAIARLVHRRPLALEVA